MRSPRVSLAGYANAVLDENGVVIPYAPFYSNRGLPEVVLEDFEEGGSWGQTVSGESYQCATDVLRAAEPMCLQMNLTLKKIDVSRIKASSAGQREIIMVVQDDKKTAKINVFYLRLAVDSYEKNLENFLTLRDHLHQNEYQFPSPQMIVDLRVPQLAFLSAVY